MQRAQFKHICLTLERATYFTHIGNPNGLVVDCDDCKFMLGWVILTPMFNIALHMIQCSARFVLFNIGQELENKIKICDNYCTCLSMRLEAGIACIRETECKTHLKIPKISKCVLLTTLSILVAKYSIRKTRDLDCPTLCMLFCMFCSSGSCSKICSCCIVPIVHLYWTRNTILLPPSWHMSASSLECIHLFMHTAYSPYQEINILLLTVIQYCKFSFSQFKGKPAKGFIMAYFSLILGKTFPGFNSTCINNSILWHLE